MFHNVFVFFDMTCQLQMLKAPEDRKCSKNAIQSEGKKPKLSISNYLMDSMCMKTFAESFQCESFASEHVMSMTP